MRAFSGSWWSGGRRPGKDRMRHGVPVLRAAGKRIEEQAAVGLGQESRVEDGDEAGVGLGADQAAKALLELDDGLGELIVAEWDAAARADGVEARLEKRVIGHAE